MISTKLIKSSDLYVSLNFILNIYDRYLELILIKLFLILIIEKNSS